jgi:hypothetical protein
MRRLVSGGPPSASSTRTCCSRCSWPCGPGCARAARGRHHAVALDRARRPTRRPRSAGAWRTCWPATTRPSCGRSSWPPTARPTAPRRRPPPSPTAGSRSWRWGGSARPTRSTRRSPGRRARSSSSPTRTPPSRPMPCASWCARSRTRRSAAWRATSATSRGAATRPRRASAATGTSTGASRRSRAAPAARCRPRAPSTPSGASCSNRCGRVSPTTSSPRPPSSPQDGDWCRGARGRLRATRCLRRSRVRAQDADHHPRPAPVWEPGALCWTHGGTGSTRSNCSRQVLRQVVVLPLLALLASAVLLWPAGASATWPPWPRVGGYAVGTIGLLFRDRRWARRKPIALPAFFILVNAAALKALADLARVAGSIAGSPDAAGRGGPGGRCGPGERCRPGARVRNGRAGAGQRPEEQRDDGRRRPARRRRPLVFLAMVDAIGVARLLLGAVIASEPVLALAGLVLGIAGLAIALRRTTRRSSSCSSSTATPRSSRSSSTGSRRSPPCWCRSPDRSARLRPARAAPTGRRDAIAAVDHGAAARPDRRHDLRPGPVRCGAELGTFAVEGSRSTSWSRTRSGR